MNNKKNYVTITKKGYSNIALIKYWGKYKNKIQIPCNPSISYLLNNTYTTTKLTFRKIMRKRSNFIRVFFSGKENFFLKKK